MSSEAISVSSGVVLPCVLQYYCYSSSRGNIFQLLLSAVILFIFSSYSKVVLLSGNTRHAIKANRNKRVTSGWCQKYKFIANAVCREDKVGGVVKDGEESAVIRTTSAV